MNLTDYHLKFVRLITDLFAMYISMHPNDIMKTISYFGSITNARLGRNWLE